MLWCIHLEKCFCTPQLCLKSTLRKFACSANRLHAFPFLARFERVWAVMVEVSCNIGAR